MDSVGDVSDRDFMLRDAGEQGLEDVAADLAMQPAHGVDGSGPPDGKICHIKGFILIRGVFTAQRKEAIQADP